MLGRRLYGAVLPPLVEAWQGAAGPAAASLEQRRAAHRRSGNGGRARGSARDADAAADRRERRASRRRGNRELKERLCIRSFGWHFGLDPDQEARRSRSSKRGSSSRGPLDDEQHSDDERLFAWASGRLRSAAARRKFGRIWREWMAFEEAGAGSNERSSSTSGGWRSSSGSSGGSGSGFASQAGTGHSRRGSAGASAGPRWGHASWTWDDFREGSSSGGSEWSASWDQEAWYEPPRSPGGRQRSGGSADWQRMGAGWQFNSGAWRFRSTWQFGDSSGAFGGGASGSGGSAPGLGSGMRGHLQLLGLDQGWMGTRCGKALKRAWLATAKREHPDMHAGGGERSAAAAKERFLKVQAAYQALLALVQPA